jgi:hypothetical protein
MCFEKEGRSFQNMALDFLFGLNKVIRQKGTQFLGGIVLTQYYSAYKNIKEPQGRQ